MLRSRRFHQPLVVGIAPLVFTILVGTVCGPPMIQAQSQPELKFDVASVKANTTDERGGLNIPLLGDLYTPTGGVFSGKNIWLLTYIYFAFNLTGNQMQALLPHLPEWVINDRFDIEGRAEGNPTKAQMRMMVKSLLEDRFKLASHYETQQLPVFAAMLAKPGKIGPKIRTHPDDATCSTSPPPPPVPGVTPAQQSIVAGGFPVVCGGIVGMSPDSPGHLRVGARNVTIGAIIAALAQMGNLDRAVLNRTGLTGTFDFTFEWTPQRNGSVPLDTNAQPDDLGPSFLDCLREQLGLKLETQKGPVEVLVLDHVERPSPN